MIPLNTK